MAPSLCILRRRPGDRDDEGVGRGVAVRWYGDRALLVEVDGLDAVAAVRTALERDPLPGQVDLVPAARTVLVLLDRPPADADAARLRCLRLDAPAGDVGARSVELPVAFDGPDVEEVARLTGRSVPDLVAELTSAELTVAFGGFAPGFGYLTGLPEHLHVPRRTTPRTRVPAGSVGLAGPFAGAYPRASPGGWQLVGRTDAVLFDVDRDPPALLAPGTRVRLREVG
jgi:KipI family sensor histidine kinase inhibitor